MARPSILGNHPPTEAEVNHALECCKAIPHIREELLAMEQEMSDIKESLGKAESQNEQPHHGMDGRQCGRGHRSGRQYQAYQGKVAGEN